MLIEISYPWQKPKRFAAWNLYLRQYLWWIFFLAIFSNEKHLKSDLEKNRSLFNLLVSIVLTTGCYHFKSTVRFVVSMFSNLYIIVKYRKNISFPFFFSFSQLNGVWRVKKCDCVDSLFCIFLTAQLTKLQDIIFCKLKLS